MNQRDFSEQLGIAVDTLKSYEAGRLPVSESSAEMAMFVFGVNESTVRERRGHPQDVEGEPYTRNSYQKWANLKKNDAVIVRGIAKRLKLSIEILLTLAAERGRALPAFIHLARAIKDAQKTFHLSTDIEQCSGECEPVRETKTTLKEIRSDPEKKVKLGFVLKHVAAKAPENTVVHVRERRVQALDSLLNESFDAETWDTGATINLCPPGVTVELKCRIGDAPREFTSRYLEPEEKQASHARKPRNKSITYIR